MHTSMYFPQGIAPAALAQGLNVINTTVATNLFLKVLFSRFIIRMLPA